MSTIDVIRKSDIDLTPRVRQLEAMFDCPINDKITQHWKGDFPYDSEKWNIGLIIGPSGCGKSTILKEQFGEPYPMKWKAKSVIDDFGNYSIAEITDICTAVGFNTIPNWAKPYHVLSNGEQFRVRMARALLETKGLIIQDEFTSVVDRQVAKIASHCVQKYVRKNNKQFVAAACHYDIIDWLQPDWILEPATMSFQRRQLRRRPELKIHIEKVSYDCWHIFKKYHYMSAELNKGAQCFCLFVEDQPAAFSGIIHFPMSGKNYIKRVQRLVTLPDFQGLGLGNILMEYLATCYKTLGFQLRINTMLPALIKSLMKNPQWNLYSKPGRITKRNIGGTLGTLGTFGNRASVSFGWNGEKTRENEARHMLGIS
ncbi:MAG: ABC transporter ATP-binding protein [Patescibacteria group bacterium]|nr:ABC transporter ATP-binding protein [Patescibacteria group bacterium]